MLQLKAPAAKIEVKSSGIATTESLSHIQMQTKLPAHNHILRDSIGFKSKGGVNYLAYLVKR